MPSAGDEGTSSHRLAQCLSHLDDDLLDDLVAVGEPAVVDALSPHARIEVAEKLGHGGGVASGDERQKGQRSCRAWSSVAASALLIQGEYFMFGPAPANVVVVEPLVRTDLVLGPSGATPSSRWRGNRFETPGPGAILGSGEVDTAHVVEHVVYVTRILFGDSGHFLRCLLGRGIDGSDPLVEMRQRCGCDTVLAGFQRVCLINRPSRPRIVTAAHLLLAPAARHAKDPPAFVRTTFRTSQRTWRYASAGR